MDYSFPLPPKMLHRRYDPVFNSFNKGLSVTLIGLPQSARSGYLKFILEYDKRFLSEFINPEIFHFLLIEDPAITADQLIHSLAAQILALNILPPPSASLLENRLRIHDPHLTLVTLKSLLTQIYPAHKFVITLYAAEKILNNNPQTVNFLQNLWNLNRNQPNSQINLSFIGSPLLLELKNHPHLLPLRPALEENTVYFPLFSPVELSYLKKRLQFLSGNPIPANIHKLASRLSAGHTVLYRLLAQLPLNELVSLSHNRHHPSVDSLLTEIWSGIPALIKQDWHKTYRFYMPLLPPPAHNSELITPNLAVPVLTAQQKLLFNYLNTRIGQIVTRDEIAQILWGKLWQQKYSDWAIDQSVSKLKKKLISSGLSLLVIRNRGYQLI
jgi:hypothetical protein